MPCWSHKNYYSDDEHGQHGREQQVCVSWWSPVFPEKDDSPKCAYKRQRLNMEHRIAVEWYYSWQELLKLWCETVIEKKNIPGLHQQPHTQQPGRPWTESHSQNHKAALLEGPNACRSSPWHMLWQSTPAHPPWDDTEARSWGRLRAQNTIPRSRRRRYRSPGAGHPPSGHATGRWWPGWSLVRREKSRLRRGKPDRGLATCWSQTPASEKHIVLVNSDAAAFVEASFNFITRKRATLIDRLSSTWMMNSAVPGFVPLEAL